MIEAFISDLDSLKYINSLINYKKACVGDYVIEVSNLETIQDALVVKNILILLNSVHKLDNIDKRPINILGWIKVYKINRNEEEKIEQEPIVEKVSSKDIKQDKIPRSFREDVTKYTVKELTFMYNKSKTTIGRWKRELSKQL